MGTKAPSRSTQARRRTVPSKKAPARKPRLDDDQRREMVGLTVMGTGLMLGLMRFVGMAGGPVGDAMLDVSRVLTGRASIVVPGLLVALGAALLARVRLVESPPFRLGAILIMASVFGALGAGLVGLASDPRGAWFSGHDMMVRGGAPGAGLGWLATTLFGRGGATVLFLLGLVAGLVLVTGASLESAMRRSAAGATAAGRAVARGAGSATVVALREGRRLSSSARARWDGGERTSGATSDTRRQRPVVDGADRFPDLFDDAEDGRQPAAFDAVDEVPPFEDLERDLPPHADPFPEDAATAENLSLLPVDPPAAVEAPGRTPRPRSMRRPPTSILVRSSKHTDHSPELIKETSRRLEETLGHFGVQAAVVGTVSGPRVTRYELQLAPGTKVNRVTALRDDLAYALAARDEIRILAPIPGKQAVGVEVPNPSPNLVTLGDIYRQIPADAGPLVAWLGLDIGGKSVHVDLAKMPHLLIAGSTGTGKSVCLNALLVSLLLRSTPAEMRMVLIDPKKVELNHYDHLPHLLTPVVTNMKNATAILANLVGEMEARYTLMGAARARNLRDWNEIRSASGEEPLPAILVVIDELADMMMVAPAEVEDSIIRLAQKSRAVGIHLVLATQRPSVDVITGMIKANVPSRIAFAVSSQVDSRVILDANGAESLLGHGDMLFRPVGSSRLQRLQGAYVSEQEILAITDHWRAQGRPELRTELLERPEPKEEVFDPDADEMLRRAMDLVVTQGTASVSLLQRRLGVGYARAGRLVDMMEQLGVVSGHEGSKPRTVLMGAAEVARFRQRPDPDAEAVVDEQVAAS